MINAREKVSKDQADVIARDAIRYTISVYNSAIDRGSYADLLNVFSETGEMILNNEICLTGRKVIVDGLTAGAKLRGAFEAGNFQRHNLGNSIIKIIDNAHARSVHYIIVISERGLDHSGVYIDDHVKVDGRWWIQTRRANMEWAQIGSRFFKYPGKTYVTPASELDLELIAR